MGWFHPGTYVVWQSTQMEITISESLQVGDVPTARVSVSDSAETWRDEQSTEHVRQCQKGLSQDAGRKENESVGERRFNFTDE